MSRLDELPPDQRAVLDVLLRQRKSYAEVATLLGIAEQVVHDRAHAALAMLAPAEARGLTPAARRGRRLPAGTVRRGGAPESPHLPRRLRAGQGVGAGDRRRAGTARRRLAPRRPRGDGERSRRRPAAGDAAAGATSSLGSPPSSRLGGAVLLGVIVFAIAVLVIVLSSGGSHHGSPAKSGSASATTGKTATGPKVDAKIPLTSPDPHSRSFGVMEVVSEGSTRAFFIEAQHLPASRHFFYAIWLYNSPTSAQAVSKSPPVGSDHRLAGGAALPSNAGEFREVLLTRETSTRPTHPGPVVLHGHFTLGG